jgi:hypothetical protein
MPITEQSVLTMVHHFKPTSAQTYMMRDGATIEQVVPGFSKYSFVRENGDLILHARVKEFNPLKGEVEDVDYVENMSQYGRDRNLGELTPELGISVANELMTKQRDQYIADVHNMNNGPNTNK